MIVNKIKMLRLQKAWSQERLADIASVNVRTVQRIEKGEKVSLETLSALASALGVDVQQLSMVSDNVELTKSQSDKLWRLSRKLLTIFLMVSIIYGLSEYIDNGLVVIILIFLLIWLNHWCRLWLLPRLLTYWQKGKISKLK